MRSRGLERLAPLAGVVFFVLVAILFIFGGDTPDSDDETSSVVSYWTDHQDRTVAFAIMGAFAAIFLVWFAGSLRSALFRAEGGEGRLSTIAFAGAVILAVAILIGTSLDFTLGETAGDVPDEVTQTLSALDADFFFPFIGGIALMLLASGVCSLRYGAFPGWLGWSSLVLGVLALTPVGFFALLAGLIWILVVSIVLFGRERQALTGTRAP